MSETCCCGASIHIDSTTPYAVLDEWREQHARCRRLMRLSPEESERLLREGDEFLAATPCGWCRGEGAIRDVAGKLGEDCPRCNGASTLSR